MDTSASIFHKPLASFPKIPRKSETKQNPEDGDIQMLVSEKEKLVSTLSSLKSLLEKTMKRGADILRSSRRRDGLSVKDPQYTENVTLQRDVERRIEDVKNQLESVQIKLKKANYNEASQVNIEAPEFTPIEVDYEMIESDITYSDPGNHWCLRCDKFLNSATFYLQHLHSSEHWDTVKPEKQIWRPKDWKPKEKEISDKQEHFKGIQFLHPIRGFYCSICGVFTGNIAHAEEHLSSEKHNRAYSRFTLINPQYENKWYADRSKALARYQKDERKRQKEQDEEKEKEKKKIKTNEVKRKYKNGNEKYDEYQNDKLKGEVHKYKKENTKNILSDEIKNKSKDNKITTDLEPHYGPNYPFNDSKLVQKTIVLVPEKEKVKCFKYYKAFLNKTKCKNGQKVLDQSETLVCEVNNSFESIEKLDDFLEESW